MLGHRIGRGAEHGPHQARGSSTTTGGAELRCRPSGGGAGRRPAAWNVPADTRPGTPSRPSRLPQLPGGLPGEGQTRVCSAWAEPSRMRRATRRVRTVVLPEPGPGEDAQRGVAGDSTACCWAAVRPRSSSERAGDAGRGAGHRGDGIGGVFGAGGWAVARSPGVASPGCCGRSPVGRCSARLGRRAPAVLALHGWRRTHADFAAVARARPPRGAARPPWPPTCPASAPPRLPPSPGVGRVRGGRGAAARGGRRPGRPGSWSSVTPRGAGSRCAWRRPAPSSCGALVLTGAPLVPAGRARRPPAGVTGWPGPCTGATWSATAGWSGPPAPRLGRLPGRRGRHARRARAAGERALRRRAGGAALPGRAGVGRRRHRRARWQTRPCRSARSIAGGRLTLCPAPATCLPLTAPRPSCAAAVERALARRS